MPAVRWRLRRHGYGIRSPSSAADLWHRNPYNHLRPGKWHPRRRVEVRVQVCDFEVELYREHPSNNAHRLLSASRVEVEDCVGTAGSPIGDPIPNPVSDRARIGRRDLLDGNAGRLPAEVRSVEPLADHLQGLARVLACNKQHRSRPERLRHSARGLWRHPDKARKAVRRPHLSPRVPLSAPLSLTPRNPRE